MGKLKVIFKLWAWIKEMVDKLFHLSDKAVDWAVKATQAIKKVAESDAAGDIKQALMIFLSNAGDAVVEKIHEAAIEILPEVAIRLKIVSEFKDEEATNEKVKQVLQGIMEVDEATWEKFWTTVAQEFTMVTSDGKISWSESGALVKPWFDKFQKQ